MHSALSTSQSRQLNMKHLLCLVFCFSVAQALRCHTCDSSLPGGGNCPDGAKLKRPLRPQDELECAQSFELALRSLAPQLKLVQNASLERCVTITHIHPEFKNVTRLRRGCVSSLEDFCSVVRGRANYVVCEPCKGEFCVVGLEDDDNASGSAASVAALALFTLALATLKI